MRVKVVCLARFLGISPGPLKGKQFEGKASGIEVEGGRDGRRGRGAPFQCKCFTLFDSRLQ